MSDHIDYYFTSPSPFSYLGLGKLIEIANTYEKQIKFKPFDIASVFQSSGALMPNQRPAIRQRYRSIELQRVGLMRNVCINAKPKYFPTNPAPADHCICALVVEGLDPYPFALAVGKAIWEQEKQIADEDVLADLLSACGHDAEKILALSKSEEITSIRQQNTQDAIADDAVGAPAYVYDGEVFWGQDRLEYLEQMIASSRAAFQVKL